MSAEVKRYIRTVVYVRRNRNDEYEPADFDVCLMDYFGFTNCDGRIDCFLEDNIVFLQPPLEDAASNSPTRRNTEGSEKFGYRFEHPSFCVAHKITEDDKRELPPEIRERGVDVGISILLESKEGSVLITRRASHMRTFPGVWVPPGGHVEEGESMNQVAARELMEETGIALEEEEQEGFRILGIWESMYPPVLYRGAPKRHHLVVYLHGKLEHSAEELQERMKLDYNEVDACVWLTKKLAEIVVNGSKDKADEVIPMYTVDENGEPKEELMNPKALRKKMPEPDQEIERLTTGTRYALKLWLEDQGQE